MDVIQHTDIQQLDRHPPKDHALTSHAAVGAASRNKFLISHPSTGLPTFSGSIPQYAGDPALPTSGMVWYDTVNDRLRGCLAVGVGTIPFILDP